MKKQNLIIVTLLYSFLSFSQVNYPIIDTDVSDFFDNSSIISAPTNGQPFYGQDAHYNGNGTITDNVTGLMWQQADDGITRDWENSLSYCEGLSLGGHIDWHLPNAKELHSIVDYSRCPDVTSSASIDPLFSCTSFIDPYGNPGQYGYYWTLL
jgi:hypothetical protein